MVSALALGCGGGETTGFDGLHARLVADDGVLMVPDHRWRYDGKLGGSFQKTAALLVYIENDHPDALWVTFEPRRDFRRLHFEARWDGVPVWDVPRRADEAPLHVEIGSEALSPGLHRLSLERITRLDHEGDRTSGPNVFERVSASRLDNGVRRDQRIRINEVLAGFLDFGVASRGTSKLSGCLFFGPQSHSIRVAGPRPRKASFIIENESPEPARYRVVIDDAPLIEVDVKARGRRPLEFEIPAGTHTVTFQVEGPSDWCYLWGAPHVEEDQGPSRPPIVLITLDTTRRDVIPPYSESPDIAPNLRRFAENATVFFNAYATSPWTLPSHASIFTGMYPSHHRAGVFDDVLEQSWMTLAEAAREAGYATAGFAGGLMASSRFGLAQGFSMFLDPKRGQQPAGVITDAAIEFMVDHADSPLFLFLNYFDPHGPYSAPPEFQRRLGVETLGRSLLDTPGWAEYVRDEKNSWNPIRSGAVPTNDVALAYLRARYEAEVAYMDSQIGRLIEALHEIDAYDEALIVMVADHGEFLGERGLFSHSYRLDRELTAVPLLIKWPGQENGVVVSELVSQVDLYPTIAAVAGAQVPRSDGIAFAEGRVGRLSNRPSVYLEEHESRFHQLDERFKIASHLFGMQWLDARDVFFAGSIECSQREGDEWVSVACTETWEQRLESLTPEMLRTLELETAFTVEDVDEDMAEKLRALGYLE